MFTFIAVGLESETSPADHVLNAGSLAVAILRDLADRSLGTGLWWAKLCSLVRASCASYSAVMQVASTMHFHSHGLSSLPLLASRTDSETMGQNSPSVPKVSPVELLWSR